MFFYVGFARLKKLTRGLKYHIIIIMQSIKEIYNIGLGPSSSHTIGPYKAAKLFASRLAVGVSEKDRGTNLSFKVYLYGSLAATGKGHFTDVGIVEGLAGGLGVSVAQIERDVEFFWLPREIDSFHTNKLKFEVFEKNADECKVASNSVKAQKGAAGRTPEKKVGQMIESAIFYSTGGGAIVEKGDTSVKPSVYPATFMQDILAYCKKNKLTLRQFVFKYEGKLLEASGEKNGKEAFYAYLKEVWKAMTASIERGLKSKDKIVPASFRYKRRAPEVYKTANTLKVMSDGSDSSLYESGLLSSYALAVSEENASRGIIVTAPTSGACGILPAVLKFSKDKFKFTEAQILKALSVAGLIGNLAKTNASISGAEAGCQAEIGVAAAMAAAAYCYLRGGNNMQIEYAAEIALEHSLGLTCDPIDGYVVIPCIERNAVYAQHAITSANLALLTDGVHSIDFDTALKTMLQTGRDMHSDYRETAEGGLALRIKDIVAFQGRDRTFEQYLMGANKSVRNLYLNQIVPFIKQLCKNKSITEERAKYFIKFTRVCALAKSRSGFIWPLVYLDKIYLYLALDPKSIELERGFSADVSSMYPTGQVEIVIKNAQDFERAKDLIKLAFLGL